MFKNNRERLKDNLLDNSLLILYSGSELRRSADENYDFQVNKNFYYFTGIDEANNIFLMLKINNKIYEKLYITKNDAKQVKWLGEKISIDNAKKISEITDVNYLESYDLNVLLSNVNNVYIETEDIQDNKSKFYEKVKEEILKIKKVNFFDSLEIYKELRLKKSKYEIDLIRKAIAITNEGIKEILKNIKPGLYEYQVESFFDQKLKFNGACDFAFKSIFASGKNGCTLHYSSNNSLINKDELILLDLGASYKYYNADISRTFPTSKKYNEKQKQIYNIVLNAQKYIISLVKPKITLEKLNQMLINYYFIELKKINLVKELKDVRKYYFHSVSHHLGLDTHDEVVYKELEAGNVITVEPGLYIEELNIGIRIEDDVLVTNDGCEVLSNMIVKEIDDIEELLA